MKIIAALTEPRSVQRYLEGVGLPSRPPPSSAVDLREVPHPPRHRRFTGDDTEHVVSWKGQSAVNMVPGYTRVRFYMKKAELYSFRVAD